MSLDFTMGDSAQKLPDGSYYATFDGITPVEGKEWQGKQLDPGIRWDFAIASGPQKGAKAGRITQPKPTPANACGRVLAGVLGKMPTPGENVSLKDFVGKQYLIVIQNGRVETASTPPQQ